MLNRSSPIRDLLCVHGNIGGIGCHLFPVCLDIRKSSVAKDSKTNKSECYHQRENGEPIPHVLCIFLGAE
jgi:hypothetical protein